MSKIIVITGAGVGLGRALARQFVADGDGVVLLGRTPAKVEAVGADVPDVVPAGDPDGDLLVVGWGSTFGAITAALRPVREQGHRVGHVHLRHLNPLPRNLGEILKRFPISYAPRASRSRCHNTT